MAYAGLPPDGEHTAPWGFEVVCRGPETGEAVDLEPGKPIRFRPLYETLYFYPRTVRIEGGELVAILDPLSGWFELSADAMYEVTRWQTMPEPEPVPEREEDDDEWDD